ncbi:MAG: TonB-dependent receptor [Hyphomicrobiales bacterium]|nr:TonB-dependent receptor [Hyphomicrobiales bacterium]
MTAPSPIQPPWTQGDRDTLPGDGYLLPVSSGAFSATTIITPQQIASSPGTTLGNIVAQTPGVTSSSYAPGAGRPIIRGLDNNRVRIQENGVGSMGVSEIGEDHGVPIDPLAAQRIEILRGPATLRWGSQAIGGVVNAMNNRVPMPDTPQGFSGVMRSAFTSVDQGREGAVIINGRAGAYAVHADMFKRETEDYRTPAGKQRNSSSRMQGASIGASYIFDRGYIGAAITHFSSLYHVPGGEAEERHVRIDLAQTKVVSKGEIRIDSMFIQTIRFWAGASVYRHDEIAREAGVDEIKGTFKNRQSEARIEFQLQPVNTGIGVWKSAIGVQAGKREIGTSGEAGGLLAPASEKRIATYIFNELHVTDSWRLQAAARIENVRISGRAAMFPANFLPTGAPVPEFARSRSFTPFSVSAGVLRDLPYGLVAFANAQFVQRAPTALELFSKGPHEATGTFEIGNPNLRLESALSFEAGLRKSKGRLRFDATVFHTRFSNYIYKRHTGVLCGEEFDDCGVETELSQIAFAQRDARFTGAEFHGQFDVAPLFTGMFGVSGRFDIVRARFSNGSAVPRIPPMRLGGGLYWYGGGWFANVKMLHAFKQNRIAVGEETPTPGYNLLTAALSYKHTFETAGIKQTVTLGIQGTNLLNDKVRNHASFKKDEVLQPGRNIRAFMTVSF